MSSAPHAAPVTFVSARDDVQDVSTLWVVGELDEFTVGSFEAELERLVPNSHSLIIELSSCTFISSVALATLLRLRRRVPNRPVVLVTESAHMTKLIRIAGLEPLFPRFDNVVDALVAVRGEGTTTNRLFPVKFDQNGGAAARRLVPRNGSRRQLHIAREVELPRQGALEPHAG